MRTIGCCRNTCKSSRVRARAARAVSRRAHGERVRGTRREVRHIETSRVRSRIDCDARSGRIDYQSVIHDDSVRNGGC